ncbi:hypothetical protein K458DRAFT_491304 [Lentithecium fluviatile CBS 122367]|uniref:Uncharacterized protein n=1 Tax=Lentithecium fluviatile CBS 122367 TaxID=1168545 RepID=A0A6G1IJS8_9PLEO|nr:hypothetical protein K458DRAFT_491304 [Lentithecium fluviatile CBS 122367]
MTEKEDVEEGVTTFATNFSYTETNGSSADFTAVYYNITGSALDRGSTKHGGLFLYFNNFYTSDMYIHDAGVGGWEAATKGSAVFRYAHPGNFTFTFSNPTDDILGAIREVAFRISFWFGAIDDVTGGRWIWNGTHPFWDFVWEDEPLFREKQHIEAEQITTEIVY